MSPLPTKYGKMTWNGGQTWYCIYGDMVSDAPPLVVVHGGPGMTHDYLLDFIGLGTDRSIIFYDQVGNGRSYPVGEEAAARASLETMVAELEALLGKLTGSSGYVLLAHSAGGCVALEHALKQPLGLKGLILANTFPSGTMMQKGLQGLRDRLDPADRSALLGMPSDGISFAAAMRNFFARHVCRVPPPPHLLRTLEASQTLPHMQHKFMGPDLFSWVGPLSSWSVADRLDEIGVKTFAYGGRCDETGPECLEVLATGIPNCRSTIFAQSSHLPHIEQTQDCLSQIGDFLIQLGPSSNNVTTDQIVRI